MFDNLKSLANLPAMLKQAQEMGQKMQQLGEEMKLKRATGAAGGGMVEVEVNGLGEALAVRLAPELVAKGDQELLEDLLPTAFNAAVRKAKELHAAELQKLSGGLDLGGMADALGKLGGPA